jgi:hypothetical protein
MDLTESRALAARLASLLRQEQHALADFLLSLAEFDRRRGWVELGYSGLFPFLHRELGLSKTASFFRKTAAELIQRFPEIVEPLRDGRLCMTTIASLAKALTPENRAEVLPRFFHRSGLEAKAIAAELCPAAAPPTRTVVTAVPVRTVAAALEAAPAVGDADGGFAAKLRCLEVAGEAPAPTLTPPAPARPMSVEPLTATQARLHLTVSPEFLEKLEAARLALSHAMPGASAEDVLSTGLDLILERDARRKGLSERPRPAPPVERAEPGASHIPAAVKREVWRRDGGVCQWPTDSGGVCGSRLRLQFDHKVMRVEGGQPTTPNVRLLCDVHNRLAARERLGDRLLDRYCHDPRQGSSGASAPAEGDGRRAAQDVSIMRRRTRTSERACGQHARLIYFTHGNATSEGGRSSAVLRGDPEREAPRGCGRGRAGEPEREPSLGSHDALWRGAVGRR